MAMNNWGGVKEHMTKKPRRFFGHKKTARKSGHLLAEEKGYKIDVQQADRKRNKTIIKELFWFLVIISISLACIYYVFF